MSPAQRAPVSTTLPDLQPIVRAAAALLLPASAGLYALAAWRLAADLGWAGDFFVSSGAFSRWQIWLLSAVAVQFAARSLNRVASSDSRPVE
jgi:hypothetical protein